MFTYLAEILGEIPSAVETDSAIMQVDLKELMTFTLTPVPHSIGTADGFLAKTDKSKRFQYLTKYCADADMPPERDCS